MKGEAPGMHLEANDPIFLLLEHVPKISKLIEIEDDEEYSKKINDFRETVANKVVELVTSKLTANAVKLMGGIHLHCKILEDSCLLDAVYEGKKNRYQIVRLRRLLEFLPQEVRNALNRKDFSKKIQNLFRQAETDQSEFPLASKKIKWLGSPAQFGHIFELLISGGYIERPAKSYKGCAAAFRELFDIETTDGTLASELSKETNSLSSISQKLFKVPTKDQI